MSWFSPKQPVVTLSTIEAEFVLATSCACQSVWLRRVLGQLNQSQSDTIVIYCDNGSTIKLSHNPIMHGRSSINVRFHFLRDLTQDGTIKLEYYRTKDQLTDIMTKPLKLDTFEKLRALMGVCQNLGIS